MNPPHVDLRRFRLTRQDISYVGEGLHRPESVLARRDGTLWASDRRGLVTRIGPDRTQQLLGAAQGEPNGLAMDAQGRIVVANIGDGRIYRLDRHGYEQVFLDSVEGKPLGAVNYVYFDRLGQLWVTVSARSGDIKGAICNRTADGLILRLQGDRLEIMADGLQFANEMRIDGSGSWLYVAETTAGRISRARIRAEGSLGSFAPFGPDPIYPGAYVDGIAFDAAGNLWVTELSRNALLVLTPHEQTAVVFEDIAGDTLLKPTSIAFGGKDLRTAFVGSLKMSRLASFAVPIPGMPMFHWCL